ncbi:MAG: hypothetical protein MUE43_13160 [Serpentinimonas sp.]|jgi:hypothetical protein|nr:hypothetical protein [Serpentinimonas sp.]
MQTSLPSADQVAARMRVMRMSDLRELAAKSGVPYRTLLKIRLGETPNPGLETVRKFFHLLPATPAANDAHTAQAAEQGVANA